MIEILPTIVVTNDIQIGRAIGATIVIEEIIIPASVITPDPEYTLTSIAVIRLR
jgi:hypothetical protein